MTEPKKRRSKHQPRGVLILHEDRDIIVVDKAPGLLTMGTDREKVDTAYYRLTDYVRKGNPKSRERVFIVHRLDREVSGILIFARSHAVKEALQTQWPKVEKHYLALVHGLPDEMEGTFTSFLAEVGVHRVKTARESPDAKLSHTAYRVLGNVKGISLLDVSLLTGRKHQIRVHLSDNGLPIVGDMKYGKQKSGVRRLALHAKSLKFQHPVTGVDCFYETRMPHLFARYLPGAAPPDPAPRKKPDPRRRKPRKR